MDKLVLDNLPAEEQERLRQLEKELADKGIIPLLELLIRRYKITYNIAAVYAGMDIAAFYKFMKGENREFKSEHVNKFLDDLVEREGLPPAEKTIWHREMTIAAVWHYLSYKAVERRFESIEDLNERKNKADIFRRATFEMLAEQYKKFGNSLPIAIPLSDSLLNDLLEQFGRGDESTKFSLRDSFIVRDRISSHRALRYIEPELIRIPAGEFWMGSDDNDKDASDYEKPRHKVYVADFWIARYPVTNEEYSLFLLNSPAQKKPYQWDESKRKTNHPVVGVTWNEAIVYTRWLSKMTGKRFSLPTEAQWEKAARGMDGRKYPWGNEWDATRCNSSEASRRSSGISNTTPVGKYSPRGDSPYGIADMSGNVGEWCQSKDRSYPYHADDGREIIIDESSEQRVLRGGVWSKIRGSGRVCARSDFHPHSDWNSYGFRVCVAM